MRLISRRRRHLHRESGTQLAEFAVVLPLLLFLALVVSEGAAFIRVHQILNNAAREGAHLATLPEHQGSTEEIRQAVVAYAVNNGVNISLENVAITQTNTIVTASGTAVWSSEVTVTLPYTLQYLPNLPFFDVADTVVLSGAAEFRNLY